MSLKLFNEMKSQKCKPNICTYTALVNAFAREGLCEKAEEIFEQLQEDGHEPDVYAYNALMEAYRLVSYNAMYSSKETELHGNMLVWSHGDNGRSRILIFGEA